MCLISRCSVLIAAATILFQVSNRTSLSPEGIRLSWHCSPKVLSLDANLACSSNGLSYITPTPGRVIGNPTSHKLPISNSTEDYGSWSYQPVCTGILPTIGDRLCVYTSTEFGRGRGISIFTTPSIAVSLTSLLPFQDPQTLDEITETKSVFYTRKIPGKGRGTLASHALQRGDQISSTTPLIIIYDENALTHQEREEFLRVAVYQLPRHSQRLLSKLTANFGGPNLMLSGIMETNAGYSMQLKTQKHYALFPEVSFLNHHCAPNTQFRVNNESLTLSIHPARAIAQDEEITISYLSTHKYVHFQPFEARQQSIMELLQFSCSCSRCLAGNSSDTSLEQIITLQEALNGTSASPTTTNHALDLVDLYKQEGFDAFIDIAYRYAALTHTAAGKLDKAGEFARKAADAFALGDGIDGLGKEV